MCWQPLEGHIPVIFVNKHPGPVIKPFMSTNCTRDEVKKTRVCYPLENKPSAVLSENKRCSPINKWNPVDKNLVAHLVFVFHVSGDMKFIDWLIMPKCTLILVGGSASWVCSDVTRLPCSSDHTIVADSQIFCLGGGYLGVGATGVCRKWAWHVGLPEKLASLLLFSHMICLIIHFTRPVRVLFGFHPESAISW